MGRIQDIDLKQMAPLRDASQRISRFLHSTLDQYLDPLMPLFAPQKVLGGYLEGFTRERIAGAQKNFVALEQRYVEVCMDLELPHKLVAPVPAIKQRLRTYPWEYHYELLDETITVSSPVKWVLAYDHPFDLSSLLEAKRTGEKPEAGTIKQLIINTLTLWIMMGQQDGIKAILEDLRFTVTEATSPVAGDLPFIVISSAVESFRPRDELVQTVTQLSGKPVFEELVDLEAVASIPDPLVAQLQELAQGAKI